ncbi:hypothetical protein ACMD2_11048 [Ananas comosus]|uniref:Uncharacterized protein n=1 Tax=Ananas comosus TaxID=4615 RepID=A0A199VM50_ANACO|nr:hypothetical protein ACMD2_11048 [Ananas comosus]
MAQRVDQEHDYSIFKIVLFAETSAGKSIISRALQVVISLLVSQYVDLDLRFESKIPKFFIEPASRSQKRTKGKQRVFMEDSIHNNDS